MIIPSIDIMGGEVVQLIEGEHLALTAGDPFELLERFALVGEVAVIDIDRARGDGDNTDLIREMCRRGPVRVGGGIRDPGTAIEWLDAGARRVIIGTAAEPGLLSQLPAERVIVALDNRNGEVVSHGWRRSTGWNVAQRMEALAGLCGGFLVTSVEREGRLSGVDIAAAGRLVTAARGARVTVAGGIRDASEVAELDAIGADAQVGMALYTGRVDLARCLAAMIRADDELWPTIITDEHGVALGLAWSDRESLTTAIKERRGIYRSRSRGLWVKGETSGATQELVAVDLDCDRDALRFTVRQHEPGFCHHATRTCWGEDHGLPALDRALARIGRDRPPGSNTVRLLEDSRLLTSKLEEEAAELGETDTADETAAEAADLIYFALTKVVSTGARLEDVAAELDRRSLRLTRRPMRAKS